MQNNPRLFISFTYTINGNLCVSNTRIAINIDSYRKNANIILENGSVIQTIETHPMIGVIKTTIYKNS